MYIPYTYIVEPAPGGVARVVRDRDRFPVGVWQLHALNVYVYVYVCVYVCIYIYI